jgi:hypothetical protein
MNSKIPCRIDELPYAASSIRHAYLRDKDEFYRLFPKKFPKDFITMLDGKIELVENIVKTQIPTGKIKKITEQIANEKQSIRPKLKILEGYVLDAENLQCKIDSFGIVDVRNSLLRGDPESLVSSLAILNSNITINLEVLKLEGFTDEGKDFFSEKFIVLDRLNKEQNDLLIDRSQIVMKNQEKFNELWNILSQILERGKKIFTDIDPSKVTDYTLTHIMKKLRRERGEKTEEGETEEVK